MVTRAKKEERVVELKEKMSRSQLAVVSSFSGLSVKEMTDLRRRLQDVGGEYTVAKNSLIKLAVKENFDVPEIDAVLKGSTALILGFDDPVSPVKVLMDFIKDNKKQETVEVRGGILEGRHVSQDDLKNIATLPSREEMVAKLMGSMQSPAKGVVVTLSGVARNMVNVLEAIRKQKEENS